LPTASSLTTFLKNNLLKFLQVLFPAEGENAIYAQGWNVNAFDQSIVKKKAQN
jgi:hypothetical protein